MWFTGECGMVDFLVRDSVGYYPATFVMVKVQSLEDSRSVLR